MRALSLLVLLPLAACGFTSTDATRFRDPEDGTVVVACGPLIGFSGPVEEARKGCVESYEKKGWTRVAQP